jgi:hypothetical protein
MNFIKSTCLLFFISLVTILNAQTFKYPVNEKGVKVACEKFEQIEHYFKNLKENKSAEVKKSKTLSSVRNNGEVIINSATNEFELHAAVNPVDEDNIVIGCITFSANDIELPISIGIYSSKDGAETWSRSNFSGIFGEGDIPIGGGDPILVFDNDGIAHLTWLIVSFGSTSKWGIYYATSSDGGETWTNQNPVVETEFSDIFGLSDLDFAADKQWMTADNEIESPHNGNVYVVYTNIKNIIDPTPTYEMAFQKKIAGADSFDAANTIILNTDNYALAQFSSIDTDRDGNIFVSFLADNDEDPNQYSLFMVKSTDGGQTFEDEQIIQEINFAEIGNSAGEIEGIGDQRLYPCPHIGVDKSGGEFDGRLYVAYTSTALAGSQDDGYDIYITTSDDQGDSWSTPQIVNDDSDPITEQFYSAINISNEGFVSLAWYDGRDAVENSADINYYLGVSKDGGQSFEQIKVSTESSDFSQIGSLNQGFGIGEYNQVVSTEKYVIPFWADGRSNNGEVSIYGFKQDKNTISSTEDGLVKINSDIFITSLSPNPASEVLKVEFALSKSKTIEYEMLDITGKRVINGRARKYKTGKSSLEINVNHLNTGQYILLLKTDKDRISRRVNIIQD